METKNKRFSFNDYSLSELHKKFGCVGCGFCPFDTIENLTSGSGLDDNEYIEMLKEFALSTVYSGIRYYFETPEQLKAFCEMVEVQNDRS